MSYKRLKKHRTLKRKVNSEIDEDKFVCDFEMYDNVLDISEDHFNAKEQIFQYSDEIEKIPICDHTDELEERSKEFSLTDNIDEPSPLEFNLTHDTDEGSSCELDITHDTDEGSSSEFNTSYDTDDFIPQASEASFKEIVNGPLDMKIKNWCLRNMQSLTQKSIDEILMIFRSEGNTSLPKLCKTLLKTSGVRSKTRIMRSLGNFQYFGIKENLNAIIDRNFYKEDDIPLLIHVDGMNVFNKSKKVFWSIMGKVFCNLYTSKPFLVALFFGNSKPYSAKEFMTEFVLESNILSKEGVYLNGKHYKFQIKEFFCDMPARAFIKCCKSHTGFYSCERCVVQGETVNNTRVFKGINCEERTLHSFREKHNLEHHLTRESSPLIDIVGFDLVKFVILDEMHMLYLGICKYLIKQLITKNSYSFVSQENVEVLQQNLLNISKDITVEFQRKSFDLNDVTNWKATQFRFFLLYGGALVLKHLLKSEQYDHFLILYSSCRISSSCTLATLKTDYVKQILRKFVVLMPHFYGPTSQTMNIHNLIHIADDVANIGAPTSQFSAFDFENSLGYIKSIIKSPKNPIAQIQRKLHIFHNGNSANKIPLVYPLDRKTKTSLGKTIESSNTKVIFSYVNILGFKITATRPDNVCLLSNGDIIIIKEIFSVKQSKHRWDDMFLKGNIFKEVNDFFSYPFSSKEIGLYNIKNLNEEDIIVSINFVEVKCILTKCHSENIAITLLHK